MDLKDAQISKRRQQMAALMAKLRGDEAKTAQAGIQGYAHGRAAVAPQAFRSRKVDPLRRMARWVQAALAVTLGIELPLTGVIDSATRAALLSFQKLMGLPQSGAVDTRTLAALEQAVGMAAPRDEAPPSWMEQERQPPKRPKPKNAAKDSDATATQPSEAPQAAAAEAEPSGHERHSFEVDQGAHGEADAHALRVGRRPALDAATAQQEQSSATPEQLATQRLLHGEALQAVLTLALERSWIRAELERSGRQGEAALLAELLGFWEKARRAPQPPAWMIAVAKLAGDRQDEAVARLRQAWAEEQGRR